MMAGSDEVDYKPQSVQQAPGKRGERAPSYNMGRRDMNKKLESIQAPNLLGKKATWFIAGVLIMSMLYFYNVLMAMMPAADGK